MSYLLLWGLIGCALFFILVVVLFRTGSVYSARKLDGTLKDVIPLSGKLAMLILPISYLVFQVLSNYIGLVQQGTTLNYGQLFPLNYGIYLILFLFDTFFIDGFVLAIWRPAFLQLPDEMGKESMKKHILISIPVGLFIGAILTLISTTTSYLIWMY
ncbi:hypothetical protein ACFLXI_07435 [Chloroflexota bacterium]